VNDQQFQKFIIDQGLRLYRDMPWRRDTRPYYILVSELMLQQTQVSRVVPKFEAFIEAFPDIQSLAQASLGDVLRLWSGLGYNRRAKYLHQAAQMIIMEHDGAFPVKQALLQALPGVGKNTAGAIAAYAFNQPVLFVETNVRAVYIYHFFETAKKVNDAQIIERLATTYDEVNSRVFYWALMDYGSDLKRQGKVTAAKSKHYKKQAPLRGSIREIRGQILKVLSQSDTTSNGIRQLVTHDERFQSALDGLHSDGLIAKTHDDVWHLTK